MSRRKALTLLALATLAVAVAGVQTTVAAAATVPYRAGQNVNFYASDARCTTGFVVRFAARGRLLPAALTAGHCSRYPVRIDKGRFARERVWRVRGRNRPPATELGLTLANAYRTGPDVLAFGLAGIRRVRQQIQSGRRSLRVTGWVRTARQHRRMRICISGRTSGTRCGRLDGVHRGEGSRRITCATIPVHGGDSGAPVYTPPRSGRVKAVGLVKAARRSRERRGMCFTPIQTALRELGARFARGG